MSPPKWPDRAHASSSPAGPNPTFSRSAKAPSASAAITPWTPTSIAAFERIAREADGIDILVNNVWGGYERMVDNGEFTWMKPFWEQPLWRWDAMFAAGVRAHYQASQLAAPGMVAGVAV